MAGFQKTKRRLGVELCADVCYCFVSLLYFVFLSIGSIYQTDMEFRVKHGMG